MDDLTPFDFDQTDKGWRRLDTQGKFLEAAEAIESYIASHSVEIKGQSRVSVQTMYFHAGQEYAMAGEKYYGLALNNFQKAHKGELGWDSYVNGTIAYINKDSSGLEKAIASLASKCDTNSKLKENCRLLGRFLEALSSGESYSEVYDTNERNSPYRRELR